MSPLPDVIKQARQAAGLTQTQAGALIGAALRTWQAYEAGKRRMPPIKWEVWQQRVKDVYSLG